MLKKSYKLLPKKIRNEIYEVEKCNRNKYLFCFSSVIYGVEKIILVDLKKKISDSNPFFKYIQAEVDDCDKLTNVYPYNTIFKNLEDCWEQTRDIYPELINYFYDIFPYKKLIKKQSLATLGCSDIKEFFYRTAYGALNLSYSSDCYYQNYQRENFSKSSNENYEHANDDTLYTDDFKDTESFRKYLSGFDYTIKRYETKCEVKFFKALLSCLSREYHLIAQVCLSSILDRTANKNGKAIYRNELHRIIDFGIFDDNYKVKLLIEVNDKTHENPTRRTRDKHVQMILDKAGIKLITFKPSDRDNKNYLVSQLGEYAKPELRNIPGTDSN